MTHTEHPQERPLNSADRALLAVVSEFERTSRRLQDALVVNLACGEAIRRGVSEGASLSQTMTSLRIGERRENLTGAMADLEAARHHLRAVCFALAQAEGHSIGSVARLWGVSRQLVQRTVREADLSSPCPPIDQQPGSRL